MVTEHQTTVADVLLLVVKDQEGVVAGLLDQDCVVLVYQAD